MFEFDLDYCSTVWADGTPAISTRLQLLQKSSLRALQRRRRRERTGDIVSLLSQWKLKLFEFRHQMQLGLLAFRAVTGLASHQLSVDSTDPRLAIVLVCRLIIMVIGLRRLVQRLSGEPLSIVRNYFGTLCRLIFIQPTEIFHLCSKLA